MQLIKAAAIFITIQLACQVQAEEIKNRPYEFRISSDFGLQSYTLEGTGFTSSSKMASGMGNSFGFSWRQEDFILRTAYRSMSTKINAPSGLTPDQVTSNFKRLTVDYEFYGFTKGTGLPALHQYPLYDQIIYTVGYDYRSRQATETTPNAILATTSTQGVRFGGYMTKKYNEVFRYEFGGGLYLPLLMSETTSATGSYRYTLAPDLQVTAVYQVNHFIDFSLGIHWLYERRAFAGSGQRGVTDATETYTNILIPLELRFQF